MRAVIRSLFVNQKGFWKQSEPGGQCFLRRPALVARSSYILHTAPSCRSMPILGTPILIYKEYHTGEAGSDDPGIFQSIWR